MKTVIGSLLVLVALLTSLVTQAGTEQENRVAAEEEKAKKSLNMPFKDTLLFVGNCHVDIKKEENLVNNQGGKGGTSATDKVESLGVSAAISVANAVINFATSSLKNANARDIKTTNLRTNLISSGNLTKKENTCVQIVRGEFQFFDDADYTEDEPKPKADYIFQNQYSSSEYDAAKLKLIKETEEVFIELLVIKAGNMVSFAPLVVRYALPPDYKKSSKKMESIAVEVGFLDESKITLTQDMESRVITFGKIGELKKYEKKDEKGKKKRFFWWKEFVYNNKPALINQTQWIKLSSNNDNSSPISIAVNLIEEQKPGKIRKYLTKVLTEKNVTALKTKVNNKIQELEFLKSEAEIEALKLENETAEAQAEYDFEIALKEVLEKQEQLDSTCKSDNPKESVITEDQAELRKAQKKINIKARKAGRTPPYLDADIQEVTGKCPDSDVN